jgi:hypothetical protein
MVMRSSRTIFSLRGSGLACGPGKGAEDGRVEGEQLLVDGDAGEDARHRLPDGARVAQRVGVALEVLLVHDLAALGDDDAADFLVLPGSDGFLHGRQVERDGEEDGGGVHVGRYVWRGSWLEELKIEN